MVKRKDFVSDGLVTLRHKYIEEELNARKGDDDISASYSNPDVDKNLSIEEQQIQTYHQIRNDLDIRLNQQLAALETQIDLEKEDLNKCKASYEKFEQLIGKFADLPKSIKLEENSEDLTRLEQLRVEFFSIKAARARRNEASPVINTNSPQISLLPELNSLHQLQMLKMGLCFALPLIIGVIVGCAIIAWAIIITWGG